MADFHEMLARSLGYKDPRIIQSLIIVKAAKVGSKVVPHQDGCSGFTDPARLTTFCHCVQPIARRCVKDETGKPKFVDVMKPVFAQVKSVSEVVSEATSAKISENRVYEYKKLEVKAGTLILMYGNLIHTSESNQSDKSRVPFNFGVVECSSKWLDNNYLQSYEGETEFEKLQAR